MSLELNFAEWDGFWACVRNRRSIFECVVLSKKKKSDFLAGRRWAGAAKLKVKLVVQCMPFVVREIFVVLLDLSILISTKEILINGNIMMASLIK